MYAIAVRVRTATDSSPKSELAASCGDARHLRQSATCANILSYHLHWYIEAQVCQLFPFNVASVASMADAFALRLFTEDIQD